jgi:hypothetical protein
METAILMEQRTENPRVGGSIPSLAIQLFERNFKRLNRVTSHCENRLCG